MWLAEHEARGRTQRAILCAQSCAPDERVVPPDNATWSENMRFQMHECRVYVWTSKHLTPELPWWICDCISVTERALVGDIADIATRAMETRTHDDSVGNISKQISFSFTRLRNCVRQKGLGWSSKESVLIMAKWGGHNLRRCYNHVKARQANQMLQKDYTHVNNLPFLLGHVSGFLTCAGQQCLSPCLHGTKDSCPAAKNSFRSVPLRVESPHSAPFGGASPKSSIPKGLRRLPGIDARSADTWSFRALVDLLCSCGQHLCMLIERTDKEWTLCTLNLSFANPPAGESVLRPILRPVHVWDGRAWQTHRPGLCGGPGPTRGHIFLGCSPAANRFKEDYKMLRRRWEHWPLFVSAADFRKTVFCGYFSRWFVSPLPPYTVRRQSAYRRQWSWWSNRGGRQTEWRGGQARCQQRMYVPNPPARKELAGEPAIKWELNDWSVLQAGDAIVFRRLWKPQSRSENGRHRCGTLRRKQEISQGAVYLYMYSRSGTCTVCMRSHLLKI